MAAVVQGALRPAGIAPLARASSRELSSQRSHDNAPLVHCFQEVVVNAANPCGCAMLLDGAAAFASKQAFPKVAEDEVVLSFAFLSLRRRL